MNSSEFYLERVGFEANLRLRLNLRNGTNLIGRSEIKDVDFGIDSMRCSGRHCIITVSGNSVELENLSKTVGTTINGSKMAERIMQLHENDVIGIVRGTKIPWDLTGNYNLFVYRLCKYTSENLLTIEIDDDDTFEISDDDDPNADLDPVDVKIEHDLCIQFSRNFNAEIKEELLDLEEFETFCQVTKKEPSNFFEIETTDNDPNEANDIATFDPHQNDESNLEEHQSGSNDSSDTIMFSPTQQETDQTLQHNHQSEANDSNDTIMFSPTRPQENDLKHIEASVIDFNDSSPVIIGSGTAYADVCDLYADLVTDPVNAPLDNECCDILPNNETEDNVRFSDHVVVDDKFEHTKTKEVGNSKRKKGPEIIKAKPLEKRRKKSEKKKENCSRNQEIKTVNKEHQKDNLKSASASKSRNSRETIEKTKITAKVKYTKDNRGTFLIDPAQMPGKPVRRKSTIAVAMPSPSPCKENNFIDKETDEILSKLDISNDTPEAPSLIGDPNYVCFKAKKLSFNDLRKPESSETDGSSFKSPVQNTIPDQPDYDGILEERPSYTGLLTSFTDPFIHQARTGNDNHNLPNGRIEKKENELKHKVVVQESVFQINPCHEIISILTSYEAEKFKTVDAFCRSIDCNMNSFGDTFHDYTEYRGTILSLMMVELWKEIELEYTNSEIHDFTTVAITDKNLEKRGDSRRMVFHCQVDSSSNSLSEGHIVFARCELNLKQIEFLAIITNISYIRKTADRRLAHFTMETSVLTEVLPINSLQIRPITVISNTLNAFRSVYNLDKSPLLSLILNPLSGQLPSKFTASNVVYKGYDKLDTDQTPILKTIYKQCINLNVPNISLLDGAAGTGKSCMISNLALQLVYGDSLPKPLRLLICSRSNRNIDEITKKLIDVRNRTCAAQKIQLVRFGFLEQMDRSVRCVSVQYMKENEQRFLESANFEKLGKEKKTLELKIRALLLDDENDNSSELKLWKSKLIKVNTLINRLEAVDKKKLKDATTILLNACDIICTTLGSLSRLQNYIPKVDVCIMDEATQCNEALSLLPFRFGMTSLVLVGDSQLPPPKVYSPIADEKNYGKSLFSRFQKLFLGKTGSPIFRINIQHRMHPEIMKWPNHYFYNNRLHAAASKTPDNFPIVPFKMLSYAPLSMESDNIKLIIDVLVGHIDAKNHSIGILCTSSKQKLVMQNKLKDGDLRMITTNCADESHLMEMDVIIIWISEEHGMRHLCDYTLFNRAVTRAKKSLLICGANLTSYKNRHVWTSLLEDASQRKRLQRFKLLTVPKVCNALSRNVFRPDRNHCVACKF